MYVPPHFRIEDRAEQFALIRARPFGLLVTNGPGGLMANPVPFQLDEKAGVLRAHLARANPQWREADGGSEALVVFQDVDAYVTPGWYATKRENGKVVPTWNYSAVHVYGALRAIDDREWLRRLVGELTDHHEAPRNAPWKVEDAPSDYIDVMLRGIVGIEVEIARMEGKAKLSQNHSPERVRRVIAQLEKSADTTEQQLAQYMRRWALP